MTYRIGEQEYGNKPTWLVWEIGEDGRPTNPFDLPFGRYSDKGEAERAIERMRAKREAS